jgi:hypothetical protein
MSERTYRYFAHSHYPPEKAARKIREFCAIKRYCKAHHEEIMAQWRGEQAKQPVQAAV